MNLKQDNLAASPKPHDHQFDVLTGAESKELLNAVGADTRATVLNDIATIILNTGLRTGELRTLRVKDVDLEKRTLTIGPSKAVGDRTVPFNEKVEKILATRVTSEQASGLIFGNSAAVRIQNASRQLSKISQRVLGRPVSLHTLRRTFAANMVYAGMPVAVLAVMCGWRCSSLPLKQLFPVRPAQMKEAYHKALDNARKEN